MCPHTVSDSKAAHSSETRKAQASVSDASLIWVEALISASPPWTASLSIRSALAVHTPHSILHLKLTDIVYTPRLHYSKYFLLHELRNLV